MSANVTKPRKSAPLLFGGILPIDPSRVSGDVIAGLTLAALAIPEDMGYTKIAGMPVITGLYTILLPIIAFPVPPSRPAGSPPRQGSSGVSGSCGASDAQASRYHRADGTAGPSRADPSLPW